VSAPLGGVFAAVLYGFGLVMLFVIRSLQHKAATGMTGFNGFTKTPGVAPRLAGICFAAAAVLGLVAPILTALQVVPAISETADWTPGLRAAAMWIGVVLALAGLPSESSPRPMGRSWRIGVDASERTDLVTMAYSGWSGTRSSRP